MLVSIRDMIFANNEGLVKELLRKDLIQILINVIGANSNFVLIILSIIKVLAQKSYFLVSL